jgi:hypothetical protein
VFAALNQFPSLRSEHAKQRGEALELQQIAIRLAGLACLDESVTHLLQCRLNISADPDRRFFSSLGKLHTRRICIEGDEMSVPMLRQRARISAL